MISGHTIALALLLSAQAAAPPPPSGAGARPAEERVAVGVSVSVRVVRPALIDLSREREDAADHTRQQPRQRRVDTAGTIWIEFS